jgi:hypothetical protein
MRARINHTGRQRILRSNIRIAVDLRTDDQLRCRLERDLDAYEFNSNSPVVFECYNGPQYVRISNGTVDDPPPSSVADLSSFATAPKVLFRLKVLDPDGSGKLLGIADQIPLTKPDVDDDVTGSLVRVRAQRLDQQLWNVAYDTDGPILEINEAVGDWRELVNGSYYFLPTVLPHVVSSVLTKILIEDGTDPGSDGDTWEERFVELAGFSGNRPFTRSERLDKERIRQWIDDVVDGFASRHRLADRFVRSYALES